jgi:hypothetical protein
MKSFTPTGSTDNIRSTQRGCPIDLRVDELTREAHAVLRNAGSAPIAHLLNEPPKTYSVWVDGVNGSKKLTGCDLALDLIRVHGKVVDYVGLHPKKQNRYAPCLICHAVKLYNWIGEDDIRCENCEWTIHVDDYQSYCTELIQIGRTGD